MTVKFFYKIFAAFLVVALLPTLVGGFLFSRTVEKYLLNHIQSQAKTRLDKSAVLITDIVEHLDDVLAKTARRIRFIDDDALLIRWVYQAHPQIIKIVAVNMDGVVQVAMARFSHIAKGKKITGFQPSGFGKKNFSFSSWNNEPLMTFHYPIRSLSSGEQRGVLQVQIRINSLFNTLSSSTDEHIQYIVNINNGHIVFHPDFNLVLNAEDVSRLHIVHQVLDGAKSAYGKYENINGEKVMGIAEHISATPFILVEETLFDIAYSLLIKGKQLFKTVVLISVFFILIAAYLFSRTITRPVANLLAVTRKIKQGDLDATIAQKKPLLPDEINILSDHFRRMVEALKRDRKQRDEAVLREQAAQEKLLKAQKIEAIGLLAGGVAHDLNNILSGIVSYPELLLLQLPEDSELRQPIKTIQQSGERASEVVADLLTVARGVAATHEICNLNTLVRDYFSSPECQKQRSMYHGIKCRHELAPDLWNISCSPIHVKKCLMNLITNGVEAIGESGIMLVSTRNQYVDQQVVAGQDLKPGEYAVVHIEDNGGGISKEDLGRIFEPFYSRKVMGRSGTGLGLTVVWNTMHDHNGAVTVTSSDQGTVFELYFPAVRQENIDPLEQKTTPAPCGHGEHILIVDDVPQQREIASQMLQQLGYHVKTVPSGEEAIQYLEENSVQLILLDMIMDPGMNGQETYERIIKIKPGQKAIIASGFSESDDVKATLRLGAGGFIKKPYSMDQLGREIDAVLNS